MSGLFPWGTMSGVPVDAYCRGARSGFSATKADFCDTGAGFPSTQRGDSCTRSIHLRGALDARHQPLCGRMGKLRLTVKTHTIDFLEQLTAFLLCFVQIRKRRLSGYRPAFFRRGSADSAGPYLHSVALLVFASDRASHTKISIILEVMDNSLLYK